MFRELFLRFGCFDRSSLLLAVSYFLVDSSEFGVELYHKEFECGYCESSNLYDVFEYETVFQLILFLFFDIEILCVLILAFGCHVDFVIVVSCWLEFR